ncbi:MAG: hypothetical protein OER95_01580 [Acidimicrobiia bacterium]|nr:hypothetical protein [Acidimicrobiia bacterium]
MAFTLALAGVALVVGSAMACGSPSEETGSSAPVSTTDQGNWYDRALWPHDGERIETANFLVYSDSADIDARREAATVAERIWAEVVDEFSVEPEMLKFPEGQARIDLLTYRDPNLRDCTACADYGYLVIYSPDHPQQTTWAQYYRATMKHELVHVLQGLLTGNQGRFDIWFIEGLAEAVSGGTTGGAIRGLDQLEDLTSNYGATSPIAFKHSSQISNPEPRNQFQYPMFQLAVEYLLDEDGLDRSVDDIRNLIIDVSEGSTFAGAFESHMGISLDEYETRFYDLMDEYLPQHRYPLFTPTSFAILSLFVTALVLGVPALAYRQASIADGEEPAKPALIGFHAGMILSSALLLVVFLIGLFDVGTNYKLNNAAYAAGRTRAYWILVGFLALSVGFMSWAVRRWARRSRLAYLIAPLILVASVVTNAAVATSIST